LAITSSIKQISNDSPTGLQELADVVDEWGGSFNYIHASAAFTKVADLRHLPAAAARQMLDKLAGIWASVLPNAEPRALANVLWASGKLQYSNPQLWSSTLEMITASIARRDAAFIAFDIGNTMHGLANVALANKGDVPGVGRAEVAAAVKQLAAYMQVLVSHPLLDGVRPQDVSNVIWACAKLRINPGDAHLNSMLKAMAARKILEAGSPQELANTIWAVSELQQHCRWQPQVDRRVWQRLLSEVQMSRIADDRNPQHLTSTLVALARLSAAAATPTNSVIEPEFAQQSSRQLLQGKAAQQLDSWTAQDVANAMWACGRLGVYEAGFLDRAAALQAAPNWLSSAVVPNVVQVAVACRLLPYSQQQLLEILVRRTKQLVLQQSRAKHKSYEGLGLAAVVGHAVAVLDMQRMAGDVMELVASTRVKHSTFIRPADAALFREVHAWMLQHQLLDGQDLAGLLSEQQLASGRAGSAD
jgi:hypothetical protein